MAITEGAICAISGAAATDTFVTSASFDSTGGGALLFMITHEGTPTTYTWSDNKSTAAPNFVSLGTVDATLGTGAGDLSLACMFCYAPTVGTGHTVTCTFGATRPHRYIGGVVLNGSFSSTFLAAPVASLAQDNTLLVDAGTLVTDAAAYLIHFAGNYNAEAIVAEGSGWAIKSNALPGRHFQARNEASANTFDPSFTAGGTGQSYVSLAAAVKESAAASAPTLHVVRSGIRLR